MDEKNKELDSICSFSCVESVHDYLIHLSLITTKSNHECQSNMAEYKVTKSLIAIVNNFTVITNLISINAKVNPDFIFSISTDYYIFTAIRFSHRWVSNKFYLMILR